MEWNRSADNRFRPVYLSIAWPLAQDLLGHLWAGFDNLHNIAIHGFKRNQHAGRMEIFSILAYDLFCYSLRSWMGFFEQAPGEVREVLTSFGDSSLKV